MEDKEDSKEIRNAAKIIGGFCLFVIAVGEITHPRDHVTLDFVKSILGVYPKEPIKNNTKIKVNCPELDI